MAKMYLFSGRINFPVGSHRQRELRIVGHSMYNSANDIPRLDLLLCEKRGVAQTLALCPNY